MAHRSGFVCIIGNPNVGKSTLMNALVGEKLSIVTAKAQTTRHRIMGIVNGDDWQIVYSDTPGILKPNYRLQQNMMNFVDGAIGDADIILYVTDTVETPDKNSEYVDKLSHVDCPVIVVVNKIDVSDQARVVELLDYWKAKLPAATVIPASAQERFNLESILDAVLSPRRSSGRRSSSTTRRRFPTAAKWASSPSRKARNATTSAPSST